MVIFLKAVLLNIYDKNYKQLMIFSILLLLLSLGVLSYNYFTKGELVERGVSLKGGVELTISIDQDLSINSVEQHLNNEFKDSDISLRTITEQGKIREIIIEAVDLEEKQLIDSLKNYGLKIERNQYSFQKTSSATGERFFKQTIIALIFALLAIGIVVFITFRDLVPSLFVVLTAFSDMVSTLAVISLLDVKLSLGGVAAFLMMIGYSVDTDILLTTRVLKRKEGTIFERTVNSLKTGLTMSLTSFFGVLAAYFLTTSDAIKQIMLILSIGFLFDIIYTWIQNTGILRWYLEIKEKRRTQQTK